jgi:hypothetical protein
MKKSELKIKNKVVAAAVVGSGNITTKLSGIFMNIRGRPMKGARTELETPTVTVRTHCFGRLIPLD